MINKSLGILILTPFFSPNIGGVETHLDDLVETLDDRGYRVYVQTYSPLLKGAAKWEKFEKKGTNIEITRYRWIGQDLFYKLEKYPLLDFLYLTPYLLIRVLLFMLVNRKKIDVIHAQGINGALIGVVLKKLFGKRLLVSPQAIYGFKKGSFTTRMVKAILQRTDKVLGLTKLILDQFPEIGVDLHRMAAYRYWVNVDRFKPLNQEEARRKTFLENNFTVLFVGRFVKMKGVELLVQIAKTTPEIQFAFVGYGPLEPLILSMSETHKNIHYLGEVKNTDLPLYYNVADIFCFPSQYDEGFGRVGMEAVACGVPVIGSNRGGIPDALDTTVSILVEPNFENFKSAFLELYNDREKLEKIKINCREYALKHFSPQNVELITMHYENNHQK